MAKGTVLAELVLEGDQAFKRAIGSSGEKMDDAAGDATGLSGAIEFASSAMEGLRTDAIGLTGSLFALQSAADEAESEIDSAGRSALTTSGMFSSLAFTTDGAALSFGTLSAVTLLSLVPALVTLSGALVPLVAAMGGFVTIAGAIAGVGAVGVIGAMATHTEELKQEFQTMLGVLKTEFAPVFDAAAGVFSVLINAFEDVISELVPSGEAISHIAGNFAQLGATVIQALPAFADLAVTLAREFLPPFVTFAQKVLPRVPGMLMRLVGVFRRVLPVLRGFGRFVADIWPDLLQFGFAALNVVAPALGRLGGLLQRGMELFNSLESSVKSTLLRLSLLAPVVTTLVGLLGGPGTAAIVGFAAAWKTNFGNIRDIVDRFMGAVQRVLGERLPPLISAVSAAWATWKPILEPVFNFIATWLGSALIQVLDFVMSTLTALAQLLSGDVSGAIETMGGLFVRMLRRTAEFINRFTNGALERLANDTINFINTLGKTLDEFLGMIGQGGKFDFKAFKKVDIGTTPMAESGEQGSAGAPAGQTPRSERGSGGGDRGPRRIEVQVTSDDEKFDAEVRDIATDEQAKSSERFGRLTGTQG